LERENKKKDKQITSNLLKSSFFKKYHSLVALFLLLFQAKKSNPIRSKTNINLMTEHHTIEHFYRLLSTLSWTHHHHHLYHLYHL